MLNIHKNIIKRINEGDAKAFEQLYVTFYVYLCAVATKYIYDPEAAKEIVNDVFLNLWNNHTSLLYPVKPYLIKAVQNRCLNHLRKKRIDEVPLSEIQEQLIAAQEQLITQDSHPLAQLENKEFEHLIADAVNTLPPKCRYIFVQHIYHNKSYQEIANDNHLSSSTVRVQIKIAFTKLKEKLKNITLLLLLFF